MEPINPLEEYAANGDGVNANDNGADAITDCASDREESTDINTIP